MNNKDFKNQLIDRAFKNSRAVLALVDKFPNKQSSRIIAGQLLRAVTSIAANIIEAQAASSKKDFVNFLNHALKSGNEAKFWLALSKDLDQNLLKEIESQEKEVGELVKILGSSIATIKGKNKL